MRPIVLSGGPAAGKSTCGRMLAESRARAAFIDVDNIRQLVVSGDATLWSGAEGERQHRLAAVNTAALARNFAHAGHRRIETPPAADAVLAVDGLSAQQQTRAIAELWDQV